MAIRHYVGIIEPGPDNWSISFPAFPGTVTAGDGIAALMAHARDALSTIVEAMQDAGEPLPADAGSSPDAFAYEPSDYRDPRVALVPVEVSGRAIRINVTMDDALLARLDRLAARMHATRSALLARGARLVIAAETGE